MKKSQEENSAKNNHKPDARTHLPDLLKRQKHWTRFFTENDIPLTMDNSPSTYKKSL